MSENTPPQGVPEFTITRTFDASIEKVWLAWSEEENFVQWWGPKDFDIVIAKMDFEPDGLLVYSMTAGKLVMWGRFEYRQILPPHTIEFINSFSDPDGGVTRAPFFDGKWPLRVHNTVTFREERGAVSPVYPEGKPQTVVTLRAYPIDPTDEEAAAFVSNTESMNQGFGGTWEKLDAYLASEGQPYNTIEAKFEPAPGADDAEEEE